MKLLEMHMSRLGNRVNRTVQIGLYCEVLTIITVTSAVSKILQRTATSDSLRPQLAPASRRDPVGL